MIYDEDSLTAEQAHTGDQVILAIILVVTMPLWLGSWARVFYLLGWL